MATTLAVGDSSGAEVYIAALDAALGVLGTCKRSVMCGQAAAEGKRYTASDFILLALNGNPTVGSLVVEVIFDGYAAPTADVISN